MTNTKDIWTDGNDSNKIVARTTSMHLQEYMMLIRHDCVAGVDGASVPNPVCLTLPGEFEGFLFGFCIRRGLSNRGDCDSGVGTAMM